jgi:hypothetical protein
VPRKTNDKEAEQLVAEFLADQDLEDTRAYLMRGRPFADLSVGEIETRWVGAFEKQLLPLVNDLASELRLRDRTPPYERVESGTDALKQEVERRAPNSPALVAAIETFLKARGRPN